VVFDHLTYSVFQPVRDSVYHWFDPGQYGVFVFFLVSGYIVPASLERKGSVRGFWVSRVFRLYPLYLFALSAMIVLWASGIGSLSGMDSDAVTASFADVFMLQSVLSTAGSARMRSGHDGRTPTPLTAWRSTADTAPTIGMCHMFWRGPHARRQSSPPSLPSCRTRKCWFTIVRRANLRVLYCFPAVPGTISPPAPGRPERNPHLVTSRSRSRVGEAAGSAANPSSPDARTVARHQVRPIPLVTTGT